MTWGTAKEAELMSEGSTTEFIRRRVRHWKTTVAGICSIVCPVAAIIWPQYATKILMISSLTSGWGLLLAADGRNVQNSTITPRS